MSFTFPGRTRPARYLTYVTPSLVSAEPSARRDPKYIIARWSVTREAADLLAKWRHFGRVVLMKFRLTPTRKCTHAQIRGRRVRIIQRDGSSLSSVAMISHSALVTLEKEPDESLPVANETLMRSIRYLRSTIIITRTRNSYDFLLDLSNVPLSLPLYPFILQ